MNKEDLARQIIIDHYNNPQNKVNSKPDGYIELKGINPSCGDELNLFIKVDDKNNVIDVKFLGTGCSICCSSTSVMTQEIKNKTNEEIKFKIQEFEKLITGTKFDEELFEDAVAYEGIVKFPARFKCAFLGWKTLKDYLENN